jgi:hypothetical protein
LARSFSHVARHPSRKTGRLVDDGSVAGRFAALLADVTGNGFAGTWRKSAV